MICVHWAPKRTGKGVGWLTFPATRTSSRSGGGGTCARTTSATWRRRTTSSTWRGRTTSAAWRDRTPPFRLPMIVDPWSSRTVVVPVSTTTVGRGDDCLHVIFFNLVLHIDVHTLSLAAKKYWEIRRKRGQERGEGLFSFLRKKTELEYFKLRHPESFLTIR